MPWCQNRLTVMGPQAEIFSFVRKARGPTRAAKPTPWELALGTDMTPRQEALSFQQLVPIPQEHADPQASEKRLWGVRWGGVDSLFHGTRSRGDRLLARWDFETYEGPPVRFLAHASSEWENLSFFLSWNTEHIIRGRCMVFRWQDLSFEEVCHLSEGDNEDPETWSRRLKFWAQELFDSHDSWIDDLTEAL